MYVFIEGGDVGGGGGGEEEIVEKTKQARAVIHLHLKLEY